MNGADHVLSRAYKDDGSPGVPYTPGISMAWPLVNDQENILLGVPYQGLNVLPGVRYAVKEYVECLTRGMQSRQMAARLPNLGARLKLLSTLHSGVEALKVQGLHFVNITFDLESPFNILGFLYTELGHFEFTVWR